MGGIRQLQRRALEYAMGARPIALQEKMRFYLNAQEIYFLGVSRGVGTCSDVLNMNILVFDTKKTDTPLPAWSIFFFSALAYDADISSSRRIVVGLEPILQNDHFIRFARTHAHTSYLVI